MIRQLHRIDFNDYKCVCVHTDDDMIVNINKCVVTNYYKYAKSRGVLISENLSLHTLLDVVKNKELIPKIVLKTDRNTAAVEKYHNLRITEKIKLRYLELPILSSSTTNGTDELVESVCSYKFLNYLSESHSTFLTTELKMSLNVLFPKAC